MAHQKLVDMITGSNNEDGFAVVEALVASAIFAIFISALGLMLTGSIKANDNARRITEQSAMAADRVESLFPLSYSDDKLVNGDHSLPEDKGYTVSYTIEEDVILQNTKHIQVTIQWTTKDGIDRTVTMDHIKPNTL